VQVSSKLAWVCAYRVGEGVRRDQLDGSTLPNPAAEAADPDGCTSPFQLLCFAFARGNAALKEVIVATYLAEKIAWFGCWNSVNDGHDVYLVRGRSGARALSEFKVHPRDPLSRRAMCEKRQMAYNEATLGRMVCHLLERSFPWQRRC